VELAPTVRLRVRVIFRGSGTVRVGEHGTLGDPDAGLPGAPVWLSARYAESEISIAAGARLANGVELTALERIAVGTACLMGAGVRIVDADFHGIAAGARSSEGLKAAVELGDEVWIGMHAMVLKGVRIGDGAVIGAGAVVIKDVPAGAVAAGNPAEVISRRAAAR
jgi:acetyltransferase-like isoleucine patch superfamily enzyme